MLQMWNRFLFRCGVQERGGDVSTNREINQPHRKGDRRQPSTVVLLHWDTICSQQKTAECTDLVIHRLGSGRARDVLALGF